ncbi:MAG: hypothetical protein EYC70_10970 [Planctomycetota bacterium]|nr:MAG: hypothetical protein EYC70_10970 [Planctomycetota bacterium]
MSARTRDPVSVLMVDGRVVDPAAPALAGNLPGVLRGEGIFEAFLVEDGVPSPFLGEHARRLDHSARLMGMELAGEELMEGLAEFLPHVARDAMRVRYTVLRGLGAQLVRLWIAGPREEPPAEVVLGLSPFRRDPADPLVSAKTVSRAGSQRARRLAEDQGAWEALLPTVDGALAECTSCNVFLVRDGVLETPGEDQGILWGVTRGAVLRGCRRLGLPVAEGRVPLEHLRDAAEVYVTNAVVGIIPAKAILGVRNDLAGTGGPLLAQVRHAYTSERDLTGRTIRATP